MKLNHEVCEDNRALHPLDDDFIDTGRDSVVPLAMVELLGGSLRTNVLKRGGGRYDIAADMAKRFQVVFELMAQNETGFHEVFRKAFDSGYDYHGIEAVRCRAILGRTDYMPSIKIVDIDCLKGGYGAYAPRAHAVYLSKGVALANASLAVEVMIELMGLHVLNLTGQGASVRVRSGLDQLRRVEIEGDAIEVVFYKGTLCKDCGAN